MPLLLAPAVDPTVTAPMATAEAQARMDNAVCHHRGWVEAALPLALVMFAPLFLVFVGILLNLTWMLFRLFLFFLRSQSCVTPDTSDG